MPWSSIDENKQLFIKMTDFHTDSAVSRVRGRFFVVFFFFVEDAFWNFPDIMWAKVREKKAWMRE